MASINYMGGTGVDGLGPMDWHVFADHFDNYTAGDWIITETGSGTRAIADARGGVLVITNGASDNDLNTLQWSGTTGAAACETFCYSATKRLYFGIRMKILEVVQTFFVAGLVATDTDLETSIANGIYFRSDDGDNDLDFIVMATSSTGSPTAIYDLVADTYVVLEFTYDGNGKFTAFVDGVQKGGVDNDFAPTTELAVTFGIKNGEAVAGVMSIDWIRVVEEI